jgi:hypothetical protein
MEANETPGLCFLLVLVVGLVLFPIHIRLGGDTLRIHRHRDCRTIRNQTMTPQEKAKELIRQFYSVGAVECKQCALIMCDELLCNSTFLLSNGESYFWNEVKKEIQKL